MSFQETKLVDAVRLTEHKDRPMIAYYIETKEVSTKFGDQELHTFQKEDGTRVSVWGFTALNRLLEQTPKGILCKVTYLGKSETANKYGNKSHTCSVFFDEDKKLDGFKKAEPEEGEEDPLPF